MAKFQLTLLIHAHQPVGNFGDVFERAYAQSYLPFVEVLSRHPSIRLGLHYTGSLLEWMERAHPEYFEKLRGLVDRRQIEIVGGGYYEPILIAIPPGDRQEQITRLADYVEKHFGARPKGAWLAERVWEPQLPSSLAPAGVEYTLVDDNHFLGAGFELERTVRPLLRRRPVSCRQRSARSESAAIPASFSPSRGNGGLFTPRRERASGRFCGDG